MHSLSLFLFVALLLFSGCENTELSKSDVEIDEWLDIALEASPDQLTEFELNELSKFIMPTKFHHRFSSYHL